MPSTSNGRWPRGLVEKQVTVPANLLQACHEFNAGLFFECHESLEEIWQEEQGAVRDAYKGLIQVAAAFVHITRDNPAGAIRLFTTALRYLEPYRAVGALGMPIDEICGAAEGSLAEVHRLGKDGISRFDLSLAPDWRVDMDRLRSDVLRWGGWGFDSEGTAQQQTILVPI